MSVWFIFFFSLEHVQRMCDELKKDNIELNNENDKLRKTEINLRTDIKTLSDSYEKNVSN